MNKLIIFAIIGAIFCASLVASDGDQNAATKMTEKAMNQVKTAANKGAEGVQKLANGVTVRVERFTNPQNSHKPGESNIIVSAAKGVGRLLRNVTVETGRYIGGVGGGAVKLVRNTSGAVASTVRDSAQRIASPRRKSKTDVSSSNSESVPDNNSEASQDDTPSDELLKQEE